MVYVSQIVTRCFRRIIFLHFIEDFSLISFYLNKKVCTFATEINQINKQKGVGWRFIRSLNKKLKTNSQPREKGKL
jgi:hypothetical protein